jgi:RsiW-degrading membrane proteinase PrsW (M82 family)
MFAACWHTLYPTTQVCIERRGDGMAEEQVKESASSSAEVAEEQAQEDLGSAGKMEEQAEEGDQRSAERMTSWWKVLLIGVALYVAGLAALIVTGNPNLFPTVVMVGSFLVPVTYVSFFYERRQMSSVTMAPTAMAFVYGGLLGVIAASILEPLFVRKLDLATVFVVGLIEELVKVLGVLVVARHRRHDSELDGLILGAAAGMGFAALESMGYAFTAFMQSQGSLSTTVSVELLRGLLSPLGHGTWTAILVSVLFRESRARRFRINWKVIGAYLLVVVLHGLWDGTPSLLSAVVTPGVDVFIGQLIVGAIGLFILWLRWREAKRLALEEASTGSTEASPA